VSIQNDADGKPDGAPIAGQYVDLAFSMPSGSTLSPATWTRALFSSQVPLTAGAVHHIVIEPTPGVSESYYSNIAHLRMVTARGRFPTPFQPYDAFDSGGSFRSPYDGQLAVMRTPDGEDGHCSLHVWREGVRSYTPIFIVEHSSIETPEEDSDAFGQPYDEHVQLKVALGDMYGEALKVPAGTTFSANYLAIFTGSWGDQTTLDREPTPRGDLILEVYEGSSFSPTATFTRVAYAVLFPGDPTPTTMEPGPYQDRSHWCGAYLKLDSTDALGVVDFGSSTSDKYYYVALRSPQSLDGTTECWDAWRCMAENSTRDVASARIPTYRGDSAFLASATFDEASYPDETDAPSINLTAIDSKRGDMPFEFGLLLDEEEEPTQRPIAIVDEVDRDSSTCGGMAFAVSGDTVTVACANRNMGVQGVAGSLYTQLFYLDNSAVPPLVPSTISYVGHVESPALPNCAFGANVDVFEEVYSYGNCPTTVAQSEHSFAMPNAQTPTPPYFPRRRYWFVVGYHDGTAFVPDEGIEFEVRERACCSCSDIYPCPTNQ
jgi:hypothetical protein